ncbi:MAG: AAA family ATPase [Promethearchaeota archaeon]
MTINNVHFENFKIFKNISFSPNLINIFIGPPNSGKTCLIEGLSLFGFLNHNIKCGLGELIRFHSYRDLFYEKDIKDKMLLELNFINKQGDNTPESYNIESELHKNEINFYYTLRKSKLNSKSTPESKSQETSSLNPQKYKFLSVDVNLKQNNFNSIRSEIINKDYPKICPIKFKKIKKFRRSYISGLNLPYGDNLLEFLDNNHGFLEYTATILDSFGLKLRIDEEDYQLKYEFMKDDFYIRAFDYWLLPESVQRFILYALAVQYFRDSIILLEAPESRLFPIYIRKLAELIARNDSNQYFITTHNPYFISIILDNVSIKNVNIYWMEYDKEKGSPSIKKLTDDEMKEIKILDYDIFYKYN